jgi:uncharacterized protein (DUF302 family)
LLTGLLVVGHAHAEKVMMVRSYESFDVTMDLVKKALESRGYTVAHEQLCDGGLQGFGYKTDFYRVIFFGKAEEVRRWSTEHPEMIPYLPLKIAVIAEADQVLVVSFNPEELALLFTDRKLHIQFFRWKNDIQSVMDEISHPDG